MNKLKRIKTDKGITLIALIITIIVLLILAIISIAVVAGDNGILTHAQNSKIAMERAEIIESAKLDVLEIQTGNGGKITEAQLDEVLAEYGTVSGEGENKVITTTNGYTIKVSEVYNGTLTSGGDVTPPPFDPETLTIGIAINSDKYGYKVTNYTVTTDEFTTGVWRLFYQDSNYTYLITDECVGRYQPSDYDYPSLGTIGKKLNSMLFTSSNALGNNYGPIAWFTDTSDTSRWAEYKNSDAVFSIGSPTVELYVASFNATASKNNATEITLGTVKGGYTHNTTSGQLSASYNKGIYNDGKSWWWLASPYSWESMLEVGGSSYAAFSWGRTELMDSIDYNSAAVRPLVCIQTPVFNSKYKLANE